MNFTKLLGAFEGLTHAGRGPAVMMISARAGEGVTPTLASLALQASESARAATVAIDLDVMHNGLKHAFEAKAALGEPREAQFKGCSYLRVTGRDGRAIGSEQHPISFRRVGFSRVLVTDFDRAWVEPGARVQLAPDGLYWHAVREHAALTLVDAPSLERSRAGLAVAPRMDGVVIVASAKRAIASETAALKQALEAAKARVLGVVVTEADPAILRLERAFGAAA